MGSQPKGQSPILHKFLNISVQLCSFAVHFSFSGERKTRLTTATEDLDGALQAGVEWWVMKPVAKAQFGVTTRRTKTFGLPVGKV
jgi:hypothetical protein